MKAALVFFTLGLSATTAAVAARGASQAQRRLRLVEGWVRMQRYLAARMEASDADFAVVAELAALRADLDIVFFEHLYEDRWGYLQRAMRRRSPGSSSDAPDDSPATSEAFVVCLRMIDDAFAEADPVWRTMRRFLAWRSGVPSCNLFVFTLLLQAQLRRALAAKGKRADERAPLLPRSAVFLAALLLALGFLPKLLADTSSAAASPSAGAAVAKIEPPTKRREDPTGDC